MSKHKAVTNNTDRESKSPSSLCGVQKMMHKHLIILIAILMISSCYIKNHDEIIPFINKELTDNEDVLSAINDWVRIQNIDKPYFIDIIRDKQIAYISLNNGTTGLKIKNERIERTIFGFLKNSSFHLIEVHEDGIIYYNKYRNREFKDYRLIYTQSITDQYQNYTFLKKDEMPGDKCGWIYSFKNNLYLLSPLPE